jgi:intracellular sulfur oxidation DsrE/DsrF family protein
MPNRTKRVILAACALAFATATATPGSACAQRAVSPVIPGVGEYVPMPKAAIQPQPTHVYRMIFDATLGADKPGDLLPAVVQAASELNALGASGVPVSHRRLVVVFHGGALPGILTNADYRAKHGVDNPNIKVLGQLRRAGVELYVCGQNLHELGISEDHVISDVHVATDALIVLATYQNNGYALLTF